jgi:hypothetical protein
MHCGKLGKSATRLAFCCCFFVFAGLFLLMWQRPMAAQQIHRNGFEGRQTGWLRDDDNVRAEEKAHNLSSDYAHQGANSEFIQIICAEGKNESNFAKYYYPTQPAPIVDDLIASVWIKANRAGVQLQARLVLPRERSPKQIDEPLTVMLSGDTYKITRRWQKLEIPNPVKLLKDQQQLLRAQLRRDVDITGAYIDRLVLNLYTGPGQIDVYVDDLEIGPVQQVEPPQPAATTSGPTKPSVPARTERGIPVRMDLNNKLSVGGSPFFFRAVRYSGAPLKTLRDAGFNTVWFDPNVPADRIEEAVNNGFWIVPRLPLVDDPAAPRTTLTSRNRNDLSAARDADGLATAITRFLPGDGVLFWDLGGALQIEKAEALRRTAAAVSLSDSHRPLGADIWDGFNSLSLSVNLVGTHRFPLMSSLELISYRDWLEQRRRLTSNNALHWTWIQTHVPDWQMQLLVNKKSTDRVDEPVGPQPEQVRLLTYIALAEGCRGLAYSSDRFLEDSLQGRDRWLMMALLNQELEMIEPLQLSLRGAATWIETTDPRVKAAVLRSDKGTLVLPIWLGEGSQCVPGQGAVANLTMIVPLIPDGAQPWEVTPSRVQSLEFKAERKLGGTRIVIPEFDLTTAIVFTSDLSPGGMVAKWQTQSRKMAPRAAQWAHDLAAIELEKVRKIHGELVDLAPRVFNAAALLREAEERLEMSARLQRAQDYANAHQEALRAMRPLRVLMRAHWEQAKRTLDIVTASPYAVSFYTLPRHWELHRELKGTTLGANALPQGDFEGVDALPEFLKAVEIVEQNRKVGPATPPPPPPSPGQKGPAAPNNPMNPMNPAKPNPANLASAGTGDLLNKQAADQLNPKMTEKEKAAQKAGVAVAELPGWTVQQQTLDAVALEALLVPSQMGKIDKPEKKKPKPKKYDPSTGPIVPPEPPTPKLGECILKLSIQPKIVLGSKDNKPLPAPMALERTYLAVNSPAVHLPPGTWVRISAWVRVAQPVRASADGFLLSDNIGEETMAVRVNATEGWQRFHLYRQVQASGVVFVTAALTGIGTVYVDDIRVEPLVQAQASGIAPAPEQLRAPTAVGSAGR